MADVKAFDRRGEKITIPEKDVAELVAMGGRIATAQELAESKLDAEYAKASTASKVSGVVLGIGAKHPTMEAWHQAGVGGVTSGVQQAVVRKALDAVDPKAGAEYAQRLDDLATAHPDVTTAGNVAGIIGGAAIGAAGGGAVGAGASRLLPMNAVGKAADLVAKGARAIPGVARAAGAVEGAAAGSALGRAALTGGTMAARGALEGAALGAIEQTTHDIAHDEPIDGQKLYAAVGHGAFGGGLFGGGLGVTGSLGASAVRGASRSISSRFARGAERGAEAIETGPTGRAVKLDAAALDAGIADVPKAENVFRFDGAEQRPVHLRPGGRVGKLAASEDAIAIKSRLAIDPDAGLYAPKGRTGEPLFARDLKEADLFSKAAEERPIDLARDVFKKGEIKAGPRPIRERFDIKIDPDAGVHASADAASDAFRLSSAKSVPREVSLAGFGDAKPVETRSPIGLPHVEPPELGRGGGGSLATRAENWARELAQDQAFRAVGGGFGLQTTRYAKEAAKYFPNGTKDLGEVAIRHGIIDASKTLTPWETAMQAGKNGTPAAMLPKIEAAESTVGERIGAITDASGARINLADVSKSIRVVRDEANKLAGREHVVAALDTYEESLLSKLRARPDGTASVQDVLLQRKGLDQLVYEEAKTLDPKGRVAALREVRSEIESLITRALDDSSGRVPGELQAEYKALKKDFHALRILKNAAEDSAARSAKGATLGLGEKMALATSLATGNIGAAPVLAIGGKLLKERGNAIAAALLTQAAERGTIRKAVELIDARVESAAKGVLREASTENRARPGNASASRKAPETRAESKARQRGVIEQGQAIVKWAADAQANPKRMLDEITRSAEVVAQGSGPKTAESYTLSALRAFNFIVAGVPVKDRRDPLDPRSTPPLTYEEADRLVRRHAYATQPLGVWDDFERGRITPEGLAAAKELMPDAFVEFQMKLTSHVADHLMRNERLTATRRLRIDKLLESPAGPDLRPKSLALLQANLLKTAPQEPPPDAMGNGPINMQVQQSGFDSVEARKAS